MKLTKDRAYCLKCFYDHGFGGWSICRGDWHGIAKCDAHKAALVKMGYLENDAEYPGLYRITEAGRKALEGKQ